MSNVYTLNRELLKDGRDVTQSTDRSLLKDAVNEAHEAKELVSRLSLQVNALAGGVALELQSLREDLGIKASRSVGDLMRITTVASLPPMRHEQNSSVTLLEEVVREGLDAHKLSRHDVRKEVGRALAELQARSDASNYRRIKHFVLRQGWKVLLAIAGAGATFEAGRLLSAPTHTTQVP